MSLTLLPAVDVTAGQAVRLVQGEAGSETGYGDPLEAALRWQQDGAEWVHLVDLDAAFGRGDNRELLAAVVGKLDVAVELSGGIRDDASLDAALATGAARVNVGTAALEDPDWVRRAIARVGDRIAVGLDVRGTTLAARGWTRDGGELFEVLARLDADGCSRYVVTDVRRDGTLTGPNVELLASVTAATDRPGHRQRRRQHSGRSGGDRARSPGSRARSSARRSTPVRSRCRKPSPPPDDGRRPGDPVSRRRRRPGGQGRQLHRRCATPATRSRWPGSTTPKAPTSWSSSTSPPAAATARPRTTWSGARPSRSSSR